MKRLIALGLLLCCAPAFADITLLLDPSGKPVPNGRYRLLVIPADAAKAPSSTLIDVGFGVEPPAPPDVPTPPQPDTLDAKLTLLLAAVQDDPDKAVTAGKLKIAYEMTLGLTANTITDANSLRGVMQGIDKGVLDSLKKTAAWKPWTDGLTQLVAQLDFPSALLAYRAAAAKLGGGPSPPTPPPVSQASKAVILIETGDQTSKQATLINQLRNDKPWSKKVDVLDPNQKDQDRNPDPQVATLLQSLSGRPLPRLVLLNSDGSYAGDESLPESWDAAKKLLTERGVKP